MKSSPCSLKLEKAFVQQQRPIIVKQTKYLNKFKKILSVISSLTYGVFRSVLLGFPGASVVNSPPANARAMGLIPSPGRSHTTE